MRFTTVLLPASVFTLAFGLSGLMVTRTESHAKAAPKALVENLSTRTTPPTEEPLLAQVRMHLRSGDLEGALSLLRAAAGRDPVSFFNVLATLPKISGLDQAIQEAGAALPWKEKSSIDLLNSIMAEDWRDIALESWAGSRVGGVPDEEILATAQKVRNSGWIAGITRLMEDAAEKRPTEFMDLLNRRGGTALREAYMGKIMAVHPELASALYRSIPDGSLGANYDRAYALQARVRMQPSAKNLMATLEDAPGGLQSSFAWQFSRIAYGAADPAGRRELTTAIASQSPSARYRLLSGALFSEKPLPAEEFNQALALSPSGIQQREALESWVKAQPDLSPGERTWIDALPTSKLRSRAVELMDQRAADSR